MAVLVGPLRLLGHGRDFCREICLSFLNAFAHFKADEAGHVCVFLFQQLAHGLAWVNDERLTGQRHFTGEFLHAAFNHFFSDFFWLAGLHGDIQLNLVLFCHDFSGHVFWLNEFRLACCDVHSQLLNQLFICCGSRDQNADTCAVQVAAQHVAFQGSNAANVDVLTNFRHQRYALFFELRFQHVNICDFTGKGSIKHFVSESLETGIFCHEVSLAVHFQNHAEVAFNAGFDHAVSRNVACFFRRFNRARFTHVLDRQLDVAVGFGQCFLTIHHACASTLTQFFYQSSGNVSHSLILG
ncbi:Conserved hypothetical protein [Erwinia tasmaniensis Et1/99]|uniref:Uncharacterized protein n=1 Tax=Erwinia tasmaniensis (strain DSM 17950 / CFBP 7177 / CIP 109463 / NCPPB 4357 / Et1/99) TaxID=465817 RepID=B2VE06_ERWT9|nr:Conserved hypothetical protein [Erwinia tasmaniensis Et1/99]